MATTELLFDAWTPLSFKRALGSKRQPGLSWVAPSWIGTDHERRLLAYKVLQAYIDNAGRHFLAKATSEAELEDHREYGDAALLVNQTLASMLGDSWEIVTEGADKYDPDDPDSDPEAREAWEFQTWIRDWADKERFQLKLLECERNSVGLGDGLYTLGWSAAKRRVRLRTYDPGFYFPALDDDLDDDEFPDQVSVAWELETDDPGVMRIRRISWRLEQLPNGETRNYPWNDEPSNLTCYMSDGTWVVDLGHRRGVNDLTPGSAEWSTYIDREGVERELYDVDLYQDFLPNVHVPNTVSLANHYGRSALTSTLQILDDLSNADTDLQASSATTGKPPIVLSGARVGDGGIDGYKPGDVWEVGENGKLSMLDTSPAIVALHDYVESLLRRLSVNSRLPESILGRIKPSDVPSGLALRLSFGPLSTMIQEMRQVRAEKYRLLFKFVHRMALAAKAEGVPPRWVNTDLEFGSFLPSDQESTIQSVSTLLTAQAISVETAVRMLQAAGVPIEDVASEIVAIQSRDFAGANELLDALGDEAQVAEYLSREVAERPEPPAPPVLPPQPPGPPAPPAPPGEPT